MRTRISWSVLLLAVAPLLPTGAVAQQHFPATEDLEVMLRYLVEDQETAGIVLGILEADGSRRVISYGSPGPDALPLGPKSVFEIGSITKVFTGILLADMLDREAVSLSDPVSMYLPEGVRMPSRNGREITLLDLATHRSALPRMPSNMPRRRGNPYTVEDMYAFLSEHELRRDIGSEYAYSNLGVAVLADVLVGEAGGSYEEVVRERILDRLGMDMTSTIVAGELRRWNTQGHENGEVEPYWDASWTAFTGTGSLRSNAEDMLTFLAANMGEPESRLERVMRDAHEVRDSIDSEAGIGLLWQVRNVDDRTVITHGGETGGYSARVAFDPELGVGFVLLANTDEWTDGVGLDFLRSGPPMALPEIDVPSEVLQTYAGAYQVAPGRTMYVRLEEDGYLTLQIPDDVRVRMHAESDRKFYVKRAPWRVTFTKDEAGGVAGTIVDMDGTERQAWKVNAEVPPPAVVAGNAALDQPLAVEDMARYEGTYAMQVGPRVREMKVFVEGDRLMAQPPGTGATVLLYQGDHEFIPEADISMRFVFTVEDGRSESLTIRVDGRSMSGTRTQ